MNKAQFMATIMKKRGAGPKASIGMPQHNMRAMPDKKKKRKVKKGY